MSKTMEKGQTILVRDLNENTKVYRWILELMSRFGYLSIDEIKYGFGLTPQVAIDRLKYLERAQFIQRFPSLTTPSTFFCLASQGRVVVKSHQLSDETHLFRPSDYRPFYQNHDRYLIRVYLALKKIFGENFQSWASERTLRQDSGVKKEEDLFQGRRVFDGEFGLMMHQTEFSRILAGQVKELGVIRELWRCGLEVELSLKSPARYRKQFQSLASSVYDPLFKKQIIPLILFLYSTNTIYDRLVKHVQENSSSYGRCLCVFGQVDRFLNELGNAPLIQFLGSEVQEITAKELNHIHVEVVQS